jgi:ABC-type bacteriocin/lantibiotic exporter with double-glycine peptidase domain
MFIGDHSRTIVICAGLLVAALLSLLAIAFCAGGPSYYRGKYDGPPVARVPYRTDEPYKPDKQIEAHTCGFHAVSAIYRAYGLSPWDTRLRFRLGTDAMGINFDPESLGTRHPDMLRVLGQDGFETELLLQQSDSNIQDMRAHLEEGYPVLALIRAPGLHWIVLTHVENGDVVICDSLKDGLSREPFDGFARDRVINAILVKPAGR